MPTDCGVWNDPTAFKRMGTVIAGIVQTTCMNAHPVSPKTHLLLDFALIGGMLSLPWLLGLNKTVRKIYLTEAMILLPYVALTKQSLNPKGPIPFGAHQRIDPFNVAHFALQSFARPFRKERKALVFNLAFAAVAGIAVLMTDWSRSSTID